MSFRNHWLAAASAALALAGCGKSEPPPAAPPPAAPPPAAAPVAAAPAASLDAGRSVYGKACAMCHAAGVSGAPKPDDKADWNERLAQGKDLLYKHALEGYTGKKGLMPAKGGNAALSDDEVKAAVDFMVAK